MATRERCDCCGGDLPAPDGPALDRLDRYLIGDGYCPGYVRRSESGRVLGCGAWTRAAYSDEDPEL
jgi:hypothetical protein